MVTVLAVVTLAARDAMPDPGWVAIGGFAVFWSYLVVIALAGDVFDATFVHRHSKRLWNLAGALYFAAVEITVVVVVTN